MLDMLSILATGASIWMIITAIQRLRPNLNRIEMPSVQRGHLRLMRDGYLVGAIAAALSMSDHAFKSEMFSAVIAVAVGGWLCHMYLSMTDRINDHERRYPIL